MVVISINRNLYIFLFNFTDIIDPARTPMTPEGDIYNNVKVSPGVASNVRVTSFKNSSYDSIRPHHVTERLSDHSHLLQHAPSQR